MVPIAADDTHSVSVSLSVCECVCECVRLLGKRVSPAKMADVIFGG